MSSRLWSLKGFSNGQQIILLAIGIGVLIPSLVRSLHGLVFFSCKPESQAHLHCAIEVTGYANEPGIYVFRDAPTAYQALQQAGGIPTERLLAFDALSKKLESGTSMYTETAKSLKENVRIHLSPMDASKMLALGIPIDVNLATAEELALIPGVGCSLARRIVEFREAHGTLKTWDDLRSVKGVGPKKIKWLRTHVRLNVPPRPL